MGLPKGRIQRDAVVRQPAIFGRERVQAPAGRLLRRSRRHPGLEPKPFDQDSCPGPPRAGSQTAG